MPNIKTRRPFRNTTQFHSRYYRFYAVVANTDFFADGPDASSNLPCCEIQVLGAGALTVTRPDGVDVTIAGIPAGAVLGIEAIGIKAAGSTATNVLVLW